jgi:hypothetical protein
MRRVNDRFVQQLMHVMEWRPLARTPAAEAAEKQQRWRHVEQ